MSKLFSLSQQQLEANFELVVATTHNHKGWTQVVAPANSLRKTIDRNQWPQTSKGHPVPSQLLGNNGGSRTWALVQFADFLDLQYSIIHVYPNKDAANSAAVGMARRHPRTNFGVLAFYDLNTQEQDILREYAGDNILPTQRQEEKVYVILIKNHDGRHIDPEDTKTDDSGVYGDESVALQKAEDLATKYKGLKVFVLRSTDVFELPEPTATRTRIA